MAQMQSKELTSELINQMIKEFTQTIKTSRKLQKTGAHMMSQEIYNDIANHIDYCKRQVKEFKRLQETVPRGTRAPLFGAF